MSDAAENTEIVPPAERSTALAAAPGVAHGFFGRQGGVSTGLYASLNCGPGSDDAPQAVAENRARAAAALGAAPDRLLTAHQIHSADAVVVTQPWSGERPRCDALVTATPGLALGALAADCAPVLFAEPDAKVVAAAHAGWRGAVGGVLEATIDAMETLGADPARILAAVGPCIAQASYEVGPEFVAQFTDADPANARFFTPGQGDRSHFDLPGFVAARLTAAGLGRVDVIGHDTCARPDAYFSHRRRTKAGEPDYGRNLSAIVLRPENHALAGAP